MFTRAGNPCCWVVMLNVGKGSEKEQGQLLYSLTVFSYFPHYPQANWALLVLIPGGWVCVHTRTLWVSAANSSVRLGVSPGAATPCGVFNQRFEDLFTHIGALGFVVSCSPVDPSGLSTRECGTARSTSCCLARPAPQSAALLGLPAATVPRVLSALLPVSSPPTGLGEYFFFNFLVVRLPHSSIFCQVWLFFCF